ncbi:MAG: putative creatininase [Nocardia sp.]|uniref:mycofactocin biosynthesis peptidyl-dipeptidase MftE n=1 Tax=Nocardia sp. TaxID=1821 RepID=UPI0026066A33|nr:mycofactocin biosynthesis peptidyl-dipeptidase MftE [Nocardia sp.]MCU1644413.1 putative creatininase [Nocardia sp.]
MTKLGDLRSPDLRDRAHRTVLAVPLGATEQHGPHLPLSTDTTIATELCHRLAAALPDIVVAPAIPYGSSGEHADFPGTLSIGQAALELLVIELVRAADRFAAVVLVNGHGGNAEPLRAAVRTLRAEGRKVLAWSPSGAADDTHAGHTETSVMLHLRPATVALDRAEPGNTRPLRELIARLRREGVAAVSPNGVLGDPTHACADDGRHQLDEWAESLVTLTTRHCSRL